MAGRFVDGVGYTPHTGHLFASLNMINFIIWDQELRALEAKLKNAVSIYGMNIVGIYLVAFDEVAVAALAENQTKEPSNVEQLKNVFTKIANSYSGITGNTSLDQNGDRKYGDYEYWVVREDKNNSASHI